jgi:uncharacterized protein (UPF0218 family)
MLVLPQEMREEVRKPFGKVYSGEEAEEECKKALRPLVSVGDQCSYDLIAAKNPPDIMIVDFKIKRQEIPLGMKEVLAQRAQNAYVVLSPPGRISDQLDEAVKRLLEEKSGAAIVLGEDDLSALLVMAYAKEGTLVYGQPDEGLVIVKLGTSQIQQKASQILGRMQRL